MVIVNHIMWDCQFNIDPQVISNIHFKDRWFYMINNTEEQIIIYIDVIAYGI
jgi:hypothetical protein